MPDRVMIFIDHSNLVGALRRRPAFRNVPTDQLVTRRHYEALLNRLSRGYVPSSHKEEGRHAFAWAYIPDQGNIDPRCRALVQELRSVPGLHHRGGLVDYDRPGVCRAKVPTQASPRWRTCGLTQKAMVEKMIDVSLATDLVRFACNDKYDLAFLVTEDRDFIPAVRAVIAEGKKVAHAFVGRSAITGYCKGGFQDIAPLFGPG